jgi:hypothetical protein
VSSDDNHDEEEKTEKGKEEEKGEQDTVPSSTPNEAEVNEEEVQAPFEGETISKGEQIEEEEVELEEDEELLMPLTKIKKPSVLTPRKSRRLASKSSSCLHDDITSQTPSSPKPDSPIPFHIPLSPPSPIPTSPPPTGFDDHTIVPPPTILAHYLCKILDLQSHLCAFQTEFIDEETAV